MIGERFKRDAGRLAVEEPSLAQIRFQRGGEIGRRAAERGGDFRLAANARVEDLGLRNLDARAEIHLVAPVLPIELRAVPCWPLARRSVKAKPPPGVSRAAPVTSRVPPVALSSIGKFVASFVACASMVALKAP